MSTATTNGRSRGGKWASLLLPLLLALTLAIFGRISPLENEFYDQLQQRQYNPASDDILLIGVNPRMENQSAIWSAEGLLPLARKLNEAGARLVVATQPVKFPDMVSMEQLRALQKLSASVGQTSAIDANQLQKSMPILQARYIERRDLVNAYAALGNFVMATSITDQLSSVDDHSRDCKRHIVLNDDGGSTDKLPTARNIDAPEADICRGFTGLGFSSFFDSGDGVVRSSDLLINVNNTLYPSIALTTYRASKGLTQVSLLEDGRVAAGAKPLPPRVMNNFYPSAPGESAFNTLGYTEVMNDVADLSQVKGRIVLIGEAEHAGIPGYATPVNANLTPVQMIATSLSNLLQRNFLHRPDWLPLVETAVLVILVAGSLILLPRMPWFAAIVAGLSAGGILLGIESWLLNERQMWVQLVTTSMLVTLSVLLITFARGVGYGRRRSSNIGLKTLMNQSSTDSLDLEFSVLRQKKPNAIVKRKIYDIADQYAGTREFAKAETALRYLSDVDPDYMDVAEKLQRISGNKQPAQNGTPAKTNKVTQMKPSGGKKLGRYEIVKTLGRGAMSTVYLGIDPTIQRKVAIKTIALADEFDDVKLQKARAQFVREAESAGRLNHPDIIGIYDIGDDANIAYLAMEYFSGTPLIDYADRNRLMKPKQVMQLIARAAEALDYAHGQNVVHRDVKPANIMYDAATDRLKITDFGIARLTDTSRTKTGVILGTPSYMSPEQLSASGVTGQSDLYSLGVTLYHLLTGTPPFRADSIPQLMDKIVHEDPRPVSELRSDLPPCVDVIVKKVLAKNPEDRYQNGKAMAHALNACLDQFPI